MSNDDNLSAGTAALADLAAADTHPVADPAIKAAQERALAASFTSQLDASLRRGNPRQPAPLQTHFDVKDVVTIPNMALSPMQVTALAEYDDESAPMVAAAVAALQGATAYVEKVVAARTGLRQDPGLTEAQAVLQLDEVQGRHMQAALKAITNADATLARQMKDTNEAMQAQLPPTALAAEVRAHVRSLPTGERMKVVTDAINANDTVTLSAVLGQGVPTYLVGLEPATTKALRDQYNAKRNPLLAKRLALMRAASEKLNAAGQHILGSVDQLVGVRGSTVQRLRDQRAKARAIAAGNVAA